MKITSFNPLIVTQDSENVIKIFEDLGFERRHSITVDSGTNNVTSVRMKNPEGFYVDVAAASTIPQDLTLIRMNVDNFEEAYDVLLAKGFRNTRGDETINTKTNKSAMMVSPSGYAFDLCQHIKE